jgi:sugar lactone lactonase YvrE
MENEVRLKNVRNWRIYDLQTEEENPAGQDAVPVELEGVHDVTFANTYMYRVSRTVLPMPDAVVAKDADGVAFHNVKVFSQTRLAFDNAIHMEDGGVDVRAHDFVHFTATKDAKAGAPLPPTAAFAPGAKLERVGTGYSNADGLTAGPDGAVYFTDAARHRIYRIDPDTEKVTLLADTGKDSPQVLGWAGVDAAGRGELLAVNREKTVMAVDAATGTLSQINAEGVARPGTELLLPVGVHNELEFLDRMLGHVGYTYRVGSNTAVRSGLEPQERDYFYAPGTDVAVMGGAASWKWRPLLESSTLAPFAVGDSHFVVSEDDAKTWRATLESGEKLETKLFAERGGTSVVEDSAGNVYIASGQVYVYDRDGKEEGVLEVPERPGSLCFGGKDGKTLFIGARGSVYAVRVRAAGR